MVLSLLTPPALLTPSLLHPLSKLLGNNTFTSVFIDSFEPCCFLTLTFHFSIVKMETIHKSWQKGSLATCLQTFFTQGTLFDGSRVCSLAGSPLGHQEQRNPSSRGALGTGLRRQRSSFFADLECSGWRWDECQESDCFGTWLVILVCVIAGICQAQKPRGVEKSQGSIRRAPCLDNPGSCRKHMEFQGQVHTWIL